MRALLGLCVVHLAVPALAQSYDATLFAGLEWREVGPYRGGRVAAVTGIRGDDRTYYFGACGGGVWKTTDAGATWKNVSDGFFGGSIGAVAVAPSDPNVVYVGGGEKTVRGNVSHGDGMWRSTDAGRTWQQIGLSDARQICRVRVHPTNPDLVWVAALGHVFGPNGERGVFRSDDGGATWQRVLYVSDDVGAVDLILDPTNPRILYATTWRVRRQPWALDSGGEGSGLWKSVDGGATWQELTHNQGLPEGPIGIAGITVSPTDPDNLYAIVEAKAGGVFRSLDAGKTWKLTNDDRALRQRAWYYTRIYADPAAAETVYVLNVAVHRSVDGGRTFKTVAVPHGDNHDLWIAPDDPRRMIEGNDGGACVSVDGGATWTSQDNQPTAQIYRVSTDNDFPYRLLGGQQDNSALRIRSRSLRSASIGVRDWEPTAGGESGHVVAKPDAPDLVVGGSYGGYLQWLDHRTGESRSIHVWPDNPMGAGAADQRYRFQWNFPVLFSPHDANLLYAAANVLFASHDLGATWTPISPDLTHDDKSKQGSSGGPITQDNTSVEYYGTIFAVAESLRQPGVLACGSDDGRLHVTLDGGANWRDVTPADLPEASQINSIDFDPHRNGGIYVAATRYKRDDFIPLLYRTTDHGATWTRITAGLDPTVFTRVVRADPQRPGLLYAGTERGVHVSFDDGASWQSLQRNLPIVPITDLAVKRGDLVAATQGRGFWILDDLCVLHELSADIASAEAHLFAPRPAYRVPGGRAAAPHGAGTNPPAGAAIYYFLAQAPPAATPMRLEIVDGSGVVVRAFTKEPPPGDKPAPPHHTGDDTPPADADTEDIRALPAKQGLNRFVWDLRHRGAERGKGLVLWNGGSEGPLAVPATYQVRLSVGEWNAAVALDVLADPRVQATAVDRQAQLAFALAVRDKLTETHRAIRRMRAVRAEVEALSTRAAELADAAPLLAAAKALQQRLEQIEATLYQTQNKSSQDPLNFPIRLNDKLAGVLAMATSGDAGPTRAMVEVRDRLVDAIDVQLAALRRVCDEDVAALNRMAVDAGVPAVRDDVRPATSGDGQVPR